MSSKVPLKLDNNFPGNLGAFVQLLEALRLRISPPNVSNRNYLIFKQLSE